MADTQQGMIAQPVVDAMLEEIRSSMQATIDMLSQRNVTYRGTIKQLELHGTALEAELAQERDIIKPALLAEIEALKAGQPAEAET
jgi:hypothetical protein